MTQRLEVPSPTGQRIYDKAFSNFLDQGFSPEEAELKADEILLEWSQPLDLPDAPASAWTSEEDCLGELRN